MGQFARITCFLAALWLWTHDTIQASDLDGEWQGIGTTLREYGAWVCTPKFGFKFKVQGSSITGDVQGSIDDDGNFTATTAHGRPFKYIGRLERNYGKGTWRVFATCDGTWEAWLISPAKAPEPKKIPSTEIDEVACRDRHGQTAEDQFAMGTEVLDKQQYVAAFEILKPLADCGHAKAAYEIAEMYTFALGQPKSNSEAAKYYLIAAERNHGMSQYLVGTHFESGKGVPKSKLESLKWYFIAAANENLEQKKRSQVKRSLENMLLHMRLDGDQEGEAMWKQAEELAKQWRAKKGL